LKQAIRFCSFGGARRFCGTWWNNLLYYITGISGEPPWSRFHDDELWWQTLTWRRPGWVVDIHTYWHRARYGWAPRDTWGLDGYLNGVLAGSLSHLAENTHGTPAGYPSLTEWGETDHQMWSDDLKRWSKAFSEDPEDVDIYDKPDYTLHNAEEKRRRDAIHQTLKEIEPWWDALWD
jgi:hypothetical protein